MCMYVCICIMRVCMYGAIVCPPVSIDGHLWECVCIYVCMYVCMYGTVGVDGWTYVGICVYVCMYVCVCMYVSNP